MDGTMHVCPTCHGTKGGMAHINRGDEPHTFEWVRCGFCKGDGTVDAAATARFDIGQRHRKARVERGETLLECARRLGTSPTKVSRMERGEDD